MLAYHARAPFRMRSAKDSPCCRSAKISPAQCRVRDEIAPRIVERHRPRPDIGAERDKVEAVVKSGRGDSRSKRREEMIQIDLQPPSRDGAQRNPDDSSRTAARPPP